MRPSASSVPADFRFDRSELDAAGPFYRFDTLLSIEKEAVPGNISAIVSVKTLKTGAGTIVRTSRGRATFLRAFLAQPNVVGSVVPSSRFLARALMAPFAKRKGPARLLEIGAGTGAVTRHLGHEMGPRDELSVCEIQPELAAHVEASVLCEPQFASAMRDGRVEMLPCAVQEIDPRPRFDYVISGLPFTAFAAQDVRQIIAHVRKLLRPGGVFSYFEYVGMRRLRTVASAGESKKRVRTVSTVLNRYVRRFEVGRRVVWANFPPAYARFLQFDDA